MKKNKLIALVLSTVAFLLFFQSAFSGETSNTVFGLISFVIVVFATLIALFIGNNEPTESSNH
jgi:hypothetical protein